MQPGAPTPPSRPGPAGAGQPLPTASSRPSVGLDPLRDRPVGHRPTSPAAQERYDAGRRGRSSRGRSLLRRRTGLRAHDRGDGLIAPATAGGTAACGHERRGVDGVAGVWPPREVWTRSAPQRCLGFTTRFGPKGATPYHNLYGIVLTFCSLRKKSQKKSGIVLTFLLL